MFWKKLTSNPCNKVGVYFVPLLPSYKCGINTWTTNCKWMADMETFRATVLKDRTKRVMNSTRLEILKATQQVINTECKFTWFSRCTFNWIRLLYYNPLKPRGLCNEDEWCSPAMTMDLCHALYASPHLHSTYCQKSVNAEDRFPQYYIAWAMHGTQNYCR